MAQPHRNKKQSHRLLVLVFFGGIIGICVLNLYTLFVSEKLTGGSRTVVMDQPSMANLKMLADLGQTIQNQQLAIGQLTEKEHEQEHATTKSVQEGVVNARLSSTTQELQLDKPESKTLLGPQDSTEKKGSIMFCHTRKAGGTTILRGLMPLKWVDRSIANKCTTGVSAAKRQKCALGGEGKREYANSTAVDEQHLDTVFRYNEFEFAGCPTSCMDHDRNNTLWVLNVRDPVRRHISEFWYSGPGEYFDKSVSTLEEVVSCFPRHCRILVSFHFCTGARGSGGLDTRGPRG
jgi:hypothetical protein